jgi:4-hydroxybenzoate polyprenyltransferase
LSALAAWSAGGGAIAAVGLALFAVHLGWQLARLEVDDPDVCLAVFKSNRDAGLILFAALVLQALFNSAQ